MRHRVTGKQLNRSTKHRKALYKNLNRALISHGRVTTTEAKAKLIKNQIDKLITKAKTGTLHSRRQIQAYFNQKPITNRLVDHLAPSLEARTSGYTRIIKLPSRRGDNASMARIEFVDTILEPQPRTTSRPSKSSPKTTTASTPSTKSSK